MVVVDVALTQKQKRFCEEYIKTANASASAVAAGYSKKTAGAIGAENLKKPQIAAYIKKRIDEQDAALVADSNEILNRCDARRGKRPVWIRFIADRPAKGC